MNLVRLLACLVGIACFSSIQAQPYPTRPVRLVVPFAAGGSTDTIARILAEKLGPALGQTVIVDNRPGATGAIAAEMVARSAPDGYTLLMGTNSTHVVAPILNSRLPFDPEKDFTPIGLVAAAPNIVIVSPTVPAKTLKEFIAYARAQPGQLSFASSGTGAITHLVAELFNLEAGIKAVHIPYKTGVQAAPDVSSGRVAYIVDSIIWSLPLIRAGKLKGLAVTSSQRSALAPDIPTVAESGLPGFEGITWFGLMAPAGTPPAVISRLSEELEKAIASAEIRDRLATQGAEALSRPPLQFAAMIREERQKWSRVIQQTGVKIE